MYHVIFTVDSDVLQLLVPVKRFAHVKCIFTSLPTRRVIAVVLQDPSEYAVPTSPASGVRYRRKQYLKKYSPQPTIETDRYVISFPHKKVNEPCILLVATPFQSTRESFSQPKPSILRRDGESSDVTVPRQVMF
jgi:hypothetical protein